MQDITHEDLSEEEPSNQNRPSKVTFNSTFQAARGIQYDAFKFPPNVKRAEIHAV